MYYLLFYEYVEGAVERRAPFREGHLALAHEFEAKGLLLGGAYADTVDGAVLVFQGGGPSLVEEFVRLDPYVARGVVTSWRVRPWRVVVGSLAETPRP